MLVALTDSPGFRRAELTPISRPLALILLGGLRELTALLVEDGRDVRGIAEPAVAAATAILGPHGRQPSISRADFSSLSAISR